MWFLDPIREEPAKVGRTFRTGLDMNVCSRSLQGRSWPEQSLWSNEWPRVDRTLSPEAFALGMFHQGTEREMASFRALVSCLETIWGMPITAHT
jgi:hypothetical protein